MNASVYYRSTIALISLLAIMTSAALHISVSFVPLAIQAHGAIVSVAVALAHSLAGRKAPGSRIDTF